MLTVVERLPRPAAGQGGPPVPVTLAVDPALVEALQVMAAGPYTVGPRNTAGTGTQAAAAFLGRLKAVAADQQVVALPYGDVDPGAVVAAGLGDVLTRSLPGTPAGTAVATAPAAGTAGQTGAGAQLLAAALGTHPRTDLAWLPEGSAAPATLGVLAAGGVGTVVVPPSALTGGARALGTGGPAAVRTTVPVASGTLPPWSATPGWAPSPTPSGPRAAPASPSSASWPSSTWSPPRPPPTRRAPGRRCWSPRPARWTPTWTASRR